MENNCMWYVGWSKQQVLAKIEEVGDSEGTPLQGTQNNSPPVAVLLSVSDQYPGVVYEGYVVTPPRPDYRVSVEGISIPVLQLTPIQVEALHTLFPGSDECAITNGVLRFWWD